jgi:hypothetical protein
VNSNRSIFFGIATTGNVTLLRKTMFKFNYHLFIPCMMKMKRIHVCPSLFIFRLLGPLDQFLWNSVLENITKKCKEFLGFWTLSIVRIKSRNPEIPCVIHHRHNPSETNNQKCQTISIFILDWYISRLLYMKTTYIQFCGYLALC